MRVDSQITKQQHIPRTKHSTNLVFLLNASGIPLNLFYFFSYYWILSFKTNFSLAIQMNKFAIYIHIIIYIDIQNRFYIVLLSLHPLFFPVAPICRPGQIQTYNVGRGEIAKIQCEVEANPTDVNFTWKFNTSISEILDMPSSHISNDRSKSIAHYKPMTEHVIFCFKISFSSFFLFLFYFFILMGECLFRMLHT